MIILTDIQTTGASSFKFSANGRAIFINQAAMGRRIKSGASFKDFYPLSCAGYAIAYENQHGCGNDMNFGIIYFLLWAVPSGMSQMSLFIYFLVFICLFDGLYSIVVLNWASLFPHCRLGGDVAEASAPLTATVDKAESPWGRERGSV